MTTNDQFRCLHCRRNVPETAFGTMHRNHCPQCLWSRHLDHHPGDRRAECGSAMEPVAVALHHGGEWSLIHRCVNCATLHENRIAGDDNVMVLMSLAARPLAQPPVPLDFRP